MQFLGAEGAAQANNALKPRGRILSIHPQTVGYTERVPTLVQVEWSAPIRYLDTKPAGWRIHFLTLNENFGTFDAKGLPPGKYTIDNVLFCVETPRTQQKMGSGLSNQSIIGAQRLHTSSNGVYGFKKNLDMNQPRGDHQIDLRNKDPALSLVEAKANLLMVAPCFASLISIVTEKNFQFPLAREGGVLSAGSGEAPIGLLSINETTVDTPGRCKVEFASRNSLALAWSAVQQFYLLAGKKPSSTEDVEAFIQTHASGVDLNSASVTVYDMMKPFNRCVSYQSDPSRRVYGDFATECFNVDKVALTYIYNFFVSTRCQSRKWLNQDINIRRDKDAKVFKLTPILVSASAWENDHMMFVVVDDAKS